MRDPVVLGVVAGTVKVACQIVCWRREMARERERRRLVLAALRMAGRGAVLMDRRPDGGVLTVRAEGRAVRDGRAGGAR